MDTKKTTEKLLQKLYEPYHTCTACPLGKLGRSTVVLGEGNPNARLVFIGEGPGRDEDRLGRPFVGRSGQLLTSVLKDALGLDRSEIFITNIVKCRPPENRKPLPLEAKTCTRLLLFKELALIKPQVICTLGATALEGLLQQEIKISQYRGKQLTIFDTVTLIPTYHPAYILRNPKELPTFVDDLLLAHKIVANRNNS